MDILDRYHDCVQERQAYTNTFEEVARYVWPRARNIVKEEKNPDGGQVITVDISDSSAIKFCKRMTSGIIASLMPVGTKWYDFRPSGERYRSDRHILRRASIATDVTHSAIFRSNFLRHIYATIRSMIVFGPGCISVEKVGKDLVFKNHHIADIFFEENSKGQIDTVFRRMFYNARQMAQEFGIDNCSKEVKEAYDAKDFSKKFEVVHAVYPRTDYDTEKQDKKKFVSEHIEDATEHKIKEGGFNSLPYKIGRYELGYDDIIGSSEAIELLPDIKMLNEMRYTFVISSEIAAQPPIIVEDDGVIGQPAVGPRDIIVKRQGAEDPKPLQTGINPALTAEVIQLERESLAEGFYNDVLNPQIRKRNITATQSDRIEDEKMVMLAPLVAGLQKELLDPLLMRVLELLTGTPELPEPIGADVEIAYQGRLAMAMSNMQTNAIEFWAAKWAPYHEIVPVLDNVDLDEGAAKSALNMGVDATLIRAKDDLDEYRRPLREMQTAQANAELMEAGSKAVKNISETPLMDSL